MGYIYSDQERETEEHALPNVEVFYRTLAENIADEWVGETRCAAHRIDDNEVWEPGWYWQAGFPGCLPDGEPSGPFATEAEAIADAQDY
tara:strand:+ start:305 stop:571 length:267 start_codon:yes stop_codon:yes gene_type:complete